MEGKLIVIRLRQFLSFDRHTKLLFIEAYILLAWARILKGIPFEKVAPMLGKQMYETSYKTEDYDKKLLGHVSQAVNIMSRYTVWESMCLVKAIAAMKMLERRKIECTLYLGMARDETGNMIAHAWLRSGSFYITGFENMEKFTVVNKFARKISK
jgi:hypothetical protein